MTTYLNPNFLKHINKININTIFEVGAHNGYDSIELIKYYNPVSFHSFECNPEAIELCKRTYTQLDPLKIIKFNEIALWKHNGATEFYPVQYSYHKHLNPSNDPSKYERNIGMSSCFLETGIYGEKIIQNKIHVSCMTLDSYCIINNISQIDLLCMDTQGSEFDILSASPNILKNIKYVILEMNKIEVYKGQKIYNQIKSFLEINGFNMAEFISQCDDFGDGLFIKN
jgi:FkbM family methyltransferase